MINNANGNPYIPFTRPHCGRQRLISLAYAMTGMMKSWFNSGNWITGTSGNTINTPPFASASKACSNALPTSSTVSTLTLVFFSSFSSVVVSLTNSVFANHGQTAYAFIWSSSHGFGREHAAYDLLMKTNQFIYKSWSSHSISIYKY